MSKHDDFLPVNGEIRTPPSGIGRSHDSERWFRVYGAEFAIDLMSVSAKAGHLYTYLTLRNYHARKPLSFSDIRSQYKKMFGWSKAAYQELLDRQLVFLDCDELSTKAYDPKNQGVAIVRPPIPDQVRTDVLSRDGGRCVYCGADEDLSMDHVIPISKEGADTLRNLVTACRSCNSRKGARRA